MPIIITLDACKPIDPTCMVNILTGGKLPKRGGTWVVENEIKPSDIFCYLYSKFGPPNGLQNLLRKDDSDNLIHWDWTLAHTNGFISFLGMNMRTEVHLIGDWDFPNCDRQQFLNYVKRDLAKYGKQMKELRSRTLEDWDLFVNPYRQLRDAITQLKEQLDSLSLDPKAESAPNYATGMKLEDFKARWTKLTARYNQGIGLAMALRAMTPVLAESFINMLLFVLGRPDIKGNDRLYVTAVRANIDVKVQSLHINCIGFARAVDWSSAACRSYSSVVNERNDLLHGNVVIDKLKFSEVYFLGTVPVFKSYRSMWEQSIGVSIDASGMTQVATDLQAVDGLIEYVLSCLEPAVRKEVGAMLERRDLGFNKRTHRLGILLPEHVADFSVPRVQSNR